MNKQKVKVNIAMILTWIRIAMIPLIVGVFYMPDEWLSPFMQNVLGTILFILAALTDAFDGYIARNYNMESAIGAFLDTTADKLMVCAALIVLLAFDRVDMMVALIIIGREITVTALREWMAKVGAAARVKVNWFGKIKAIAQMVAIPMLLFWEPAFGIDMAWLGTILIYVAAILTIYSMIVYLRAASPYLSEDTPVK
jgi:CDP-diacylglycerol--glycerol-3-phosphate 3-phosphatidyltransferase